MDPMSWGFTEVWNDTSSLRAERPMRARDYLWASEIGSSYVDLFLKLKATPPTNPITERSMRKYEAGKIWEWVVEMVLRRAGILLETQTYVTYQYPELMKVTGKLDHLAGGTPDYEKAEAYFKKTDELPDFIANRASVVVQQMKEKYPTGLKEVVLEIKSSSSFQFDRMEKYNVPADPKNMMQCYHYLKGTNHDEGHVVYICKDDTRMLEFGIMKGSDVWEKQYHDFIAEFTRYFKVGERPPLEPEVLWVPESSRFASNWKVEYSSYLNLLYGYEEPDIYHDRWEPKVAQFNRVLRRVITGKKITAANEEIIREVKLYFPNFDQIVDQAKSKLEADEITNGEMEDDGSQEE